MSGGVVYCKPTGFRMFLKVKNFGPIQEGFSSSADGYFEMTRFSVFIGDQGTGKSTVAKLYSTLSWLEKAFVRRYYDLFSLQDFVHLCCYQRIPEEYFSTATEIGYKGAAFAFEIKNSSFKFSRNDGAYICPKILYTPSERNLLSVLDDLERTNALSQLLKDYKAEMRLANKVLAASDSMRLLGYDIRYDKRTDTNYVTPRGDAVSIPVTEASSGIQSVVPLFIVSEALSSEVHKPVWERLKDANASIQALVLDTMGEEQKKERLRRFITSGIGKSLPFDDADLGKALDRYVNSRFMHIVEEPEQNLFPSSQRAVLSGLVSQYNRSGRNALILTTHSPYILSAINNCLYAEKIFAETGRTLPELPAEQFVSIDDMSAYKLDSGRIESIKDSEYNLIDSTAIDDCSSEINALYEKLADLESAR